ncbi:hypothetical protein [uncultured Hyphomonas sp.]|uniref:hypothetical protein n=1 Tax=uncultured Hyphomonas sp. TaxID=225298 RepID=UPI002AABBD34|nr:hypothetical protein [uncultured Hyphomonas sp.]
MTIKLIPAAISLAIAAISSAPAQAETASACPADAEQKLYDMEMAIRQGTQTDPAAILELAEWAVETCPDRPDAQGIASTLASAVMGTATEADTLERYITLTFKAITQGDYAWTPKHEPSVLKQPDGSEAPYYGYNAGTTALLQYALPFTITLAKAGRLHPIISGVPYTSCPFSERADFRVREEANFWNRLAKDNYNQAGFVWVENRLNSLHAACPSHRKELDYYIARLYGQEIDRLTLWRYSHNDQGSWALSKWYWHNPIAGIVNEESVMEEKKAELDAIARPMAEKVRPHIASLMQTPHDDIRVYNGDLEKVEDWDEAVKRLDSTIRE